MFITIGGMMGVKKARKKIIGWGVLLVLIVGAVWFWQVCQQPMSKEDIPVTVEIHGGTSEVVKQLHNAGLISSPTIAKVYLKLHKHTFKANTYVLNKNMNMSALFSAMEDGKHVVQTKMQVIEGATLSSIARNVATISQTTEQEVLQTWNNPEYLKKLTSKYWFLEGVTDQHTIFPLEGYLAPETYVFSAEKPSVDEITEQMLKQMETNLKPYKSTIASFQVQGKPASLHQFLTFASIVQKESLHAADFSKIAGVFMHRLDTGMKLQSDVTVNYANKESKIDLTHRDLQVDSKYNTYKYPGLPIGPIASVSKETIDACLHYENTDNLYFFAIKGGTVIYTKTYEQHMSEIKKYKEKGLWLGN